MKSFFGLSGSGNFHLTHDLRDAGLRYYAATHEAGCVAMADGYARTSKEIGVATVHQGPGLTNCLSALREAVKSHTPLVLLAADLPESAREHNQFVDQRAVAESIGAAVRVIGEPDSAVQETVTSFLQCRAEQRPVVLLLPVDIQGMAVGKTALDPRLLQPPTPDDPDAASAEEAAELLRAAAHPVVLAGRGAAPAGDAISDLAKALRAPVLTSTQAHSVTNPDWPAALVGGFGTQTARELLAEADVVLVLGCSLNGWTLAGNADLADHARIIQVDVDSSVWEKNNIHLGIAGDCAETAKAIRARLGEGVPASQRLVAAEHPPSMSLDQTRNGLIDPRELTLVLDRILPMERIVSIDSGHFMIFPASLLRAPDPTGFLLAQAFMSMGMSVAEAIGAAAARSDRVVTACLGDGGAKMSLLELDTAVRNDLPILVVIYNDSAYGAEVHDFADSGRPADTVQFRDVDFSTVARGLGAEALTVRRKEDLRYVTEWLETRHRPLVIDAKIDPTIQGDWLE